MLNVLFVCTGNICRSPMAEAVFREMVQQAGLGDQFRVDSAGISAEEVGNTVHSGTVGVLKKHRIPQNPQRYARQITPQDLTEFDYLLAMDRGHLRYMQQRAGTSKAEIKLFLEDARQAGTVTLTEVPDPWYDGEYDRTYDLVTKGCAAFLKRLRAERSL
jgi:protein-tyrosine phosphatase